MQVILNTKVLKDNDLTLGEALAMLFPFAKLSYKNSCDKLVDKGLAMFDMVDKDELLLSNEAKFKCYKVLIESSPKLKECPIKDFRQLATSLMSLYPHGDKQGSKYSYSWRGSIEEVEFRLKELVVRYNCTFDYWEARRATGDYVHSFDGKDNTYMKTLKNFILKRSPEFSSDFMSTIEHNREIDKI